MFILEVLSLIDSARILALYFGSMSPADFSQEFFAYCLRKRVEMLEFNHNAEIYPQWSPESVMQVEDILAFCCAKAHSNGERIINAT